MDALLAHHTQHCVAVHIHTTHTKCTVLARQVRMSDAPPPWAGPGAWGAAVSVRREWEAGGKQRLAAPEEVVVQVGGGGWVRVRLA